MSSASSTSNSQRPRILLQFNQHKEGSVPTIRTVQDGPTTEEEYEEEDDEDDEVDQLLSTEDEGTGQAKAATSASAAGASKPRVRSQRPSVQPPIPLSRLESIIDSEIGEAMSKEALFVLSAATDAFIKRLADTGYKRSSTMKRATVNYHDVASVVHERHELHFLQETIPQPIGLEEALRLRDVKEKSLLEPLLSTPAPARPITIPVPPQYPSLSITLPARSISASASASGSNAPSPRPAFKGTFTLPAPSPLPTPAPASSPAMTPIPVTTSTSTSKPPPTKGKRKSKQPVNNPAEPVVNSTPGTIPSETHPPTPANGTAQMPAPPPAETISAPAPPSQPRRMSMREPKPRRRPDDMEDHPRPPPAPPTSPVKESTSTNVAKTATGKTRQPRAKGKGKAKADAKPSPNATGKNGVNHTRTNGHAPTTGRVTRSRTGSAAVVPQMQAQVGGSAEQMVVDQSSGHGSGSNGELLSGLGTGLLDGSVGSGGAENVGRTIYSSGKATDAESTSH